MRLKRDSLVFLSGGTSTTAAAVIADNVIVRGDGGARGVQGSVLVIADTTGVMSGWTTGAGLTMHGGGTITGASGSLDFVASGTAQSITLTPSTTGEVRITNATTSDQVLASFFQSGLSVGQASYLSFGRSTSAYESINLSFLRVGAGNSNNYLQFAAAAGNPIMRLLGSGVVTINTGNLLLGGLTTNGTGALQLNTHTTAAGGFSLSPDNYFFRTTGFGVNWNTGATGTAGMFTIRDSGNTARISVNALGSIDHDGYSSPGTYFKASTDTRSGAGAVSVTKDTTKLTSTGVAEAITLADGVDGQIKRIIHDVDGGSMVLTPTTKTGYTTITFTNAGDAVTLEFVTTRGWIVTGSFGAVIA